MFRPSTLPLITAVLFCLAAPRIHGAELIRNGDFEQGNKEFRTDYKHSAGDIVPEFAYDIAKSPSDVHRDAKKYGDHTSGKGNLMAVNGGNKADAVLWGQTVKVRPDGEYTFTLWITPWYAPAPAKLDVRINGKSIGKITAGDTCGEWKELNVKWKADKEGTADIEIFNQATEVSGNDFVIDDISLKGPAAEPEPKPQERKAVFELRLPADAVVEINGQKTSSTGEIRRFESPEMPVGKKYAYQLTVTWRGQTIKKEISITPDEPSVHDLRSEFRPPSQ